MTDSEIANAVRELTVTLVEQIFNYFEKTHYKTGRDVMTILTSTITSTMVSSLSHIRKFMHAESQEFIDKDIEAFRLAMREIFHKPETLQ
jgi:hypothetical protein